MSEHLGAKPMYENVLPFASHMIGDKGYDSDEFRAALNAKGFKRCIPPRRARQAQTLCRHKNYIVGIILPAAL